MDAIVAKDQYAAQQNKKLKNAARRARKETPSVNTKPQHTVICTYAECKAQDLKFPGSLFATGPGTLNQHRADVHNAEPILFMKNYTPKVQPTKRASLRARVDYLYKYLKLDEPELDMAAALASPTSSHEQSETGDE